MLPAMKLTDATLFRQQALIGGVKQPGLGREGGRTGIDEYLETLYVNHRGLG